MQDHLEELQSFVAVGSQTLKIVRKINASIKNISTSPNYVVDFEPIGAFQSVDEFTRKFWTIMLKFMSRHRLCKAGWECRIYDSHSGQYYNVAYDSNICGIESLTPYWFEVDDSFLFLACIDKKRMYIPDDPKSSTKKETTKSKTEEILDIVQSRVLALNRLKGALPNGLLRGISEAQLRVYSENIRTGAWDLKRCIREITTSRMQKHSSVQQKHMSGAYQAPMANSPVPKHTNCAFPQQPFAVHQPFNEGFVQSTTSWVCDSCTFENTYRDHPQKCAVCGTVRKRRWAAYKAKNTVIASAAPQKQKMIRTLLVLVEEYEDDGLFRAVKKMNKKGYLNGEPERELALKCLFFAGRLEWENVMSAISEYALKELDPTEDTYYKVIKTREEMFPSSSACAA
eukprot:12872_1